MKVTIIGAGLMGAQIGAEYAAAGNPVTLVTRTRASATSAVVRLNEAVRFMADAGLVDRTAVDAGRRTATATDVATAARGADIVVESLPEDPDLKIEVLRIAAAAAPDALLASNTSSLSITTLAERAGAPTRLVGTHYWNPPTLMPLVEVVRGARTSDEVVNRVVDVLRSLGKEPVVVGDVPGFVWNRLQFALLREATWLVTNGVADPETVDLIVRRGLGRRLSLVGPFETMDLGGRETFKRIARQLWTVLADDVDPESLDAIVTPSPEALAERRNVRDRALAELARRDRDGTPLA